MRNFTCRKCKSSLHLELVMFEYSYQMRNYTPATPRNASDPESRIILYQTVKTSDVMLIYTKLSVNQ